MWIIFYPIQSIGNHCWYISLVHLCTITFYWKILICVDGPVGWGSRIYRLHLCRRGRLPQRMSRVWHKTIWWWGSSLNSLANVEYPFIAIAPRSTLARSGNTWLDPIYGLNKTKRCTYANLSCLKWNYFRNLNCVLMLNWTVKNWTVFDI